MTNPIDNQIINHFNINIMKKLSILFAALLVSVSTLFAADEVYKTISFAADNATRGDKVSNYTSTWTSATDGFQVSIQNFNNNQWNSNWTYIKCGRKTNKNIEYPSVATITTKAVIDKAITKVVVTLDAVNTKYLNSTTLTVASDADFTKDVQTISVTAAQGELPYVVTTPAENMYYKLTYDCASGTDNGFVQISKIEYYVAAPDVDATDIALDQSTLSLEQHKYTTLAATLTPADATTPIVWSSSDENIATVANGVVTAKAIGTAKIYATAGTVKDSCAVTVTAATPITVAQAVEIAKTVSANNEIAAGGMYVIRGYITKIAYAYSASSNNMSVWMDDTKDGSDSKFEAYKVIPVHTADQDIVVGDFVEVIGDITKYNTTYETAANGSIQRLNMRDSYTVGATDCDYASLAAAFTAYNTNAADGMVTGDVTLQIASDLKETKNVGIQNPTDYTLTITVDKPEARTISFSQAADNAGPSGNICIGCDMTLTHTSASVATKNIVIDGAYNGNAENSYLTIKSIKGCHKGNGPILIYGNVTNCTVKNCNVIAENGAGSSLFLVNIRTQNATAYTPTDITIENNYLYAITGNADQGIQLTKGSGTTTPKNIKIEDNTIIARTRGIFINGAENATIFGNEVQVLQTNLGSISYGIWGFANTTGVFNVNNNVITALTTGATASGHGIVGICAGAGNWYIRNNYVSGFQVASTAANGITLTGIQGSAAAGVLVIEHNTVALADQTNAVANPDLNKVCMIRSMSTKATVRNNLVYSAEADFNNALISPAGTLAGNVYCTQSYIGSADSIKTLVDYKAFYEATAKTVASVEFVNLENGNLDLTGASDGDVNLGVDALTDVTTDIYGTVRAAYTYAGAYEGTTLTKPGPVTGMDEIEEVAAGVQKIVRNGQVLILRDGKTYNVMGQVVE